MKMLYTLVLMVAASFGSAKPGNAGTSDWFETDGARMRLIALRAADGKTIKAGLQFELHRGWKTYWRSPGGSGLPPQVHFLGSKNLSQIEMQHPVPELFVEENGTSVGYKGNVVFPIEANVEARDKAATLAASGVVGICSDICIPVPFSLSLEDKGRGGSQFDVVSALNKSRAELPNKPTSQFQVSSAIFDPKKKQVLVSATVPNEAERLEIFVEGPSSWYLYAGKLVERNGTSATFTIDVQDAPKGEQIIDRALTLTLSADGNGIEQKVQISK